MKLLFTICISMMLIHSSIYSQEDIRKTFEYNIMPDEQGEFFTAKKKSIFIFENGRTDNIKLFMPTLSEPFRLHKVSEEIKGSRQGTEYFGYVMRDDNNQMFSVYFMGNGDILMINTENKMNILFTNNP